MRYDGQRFALAMVVLHAGAIVLARRLVPQTQDSGVRDGPRAIGMADLRACGPIACAGGCLGTCDASALGHEILDPREAAEVMHRIEQDHTQHLAEAGNGLSAITGLRLVLLGRLDNGQRDIAEPLIIVVHQSEVDCDTLLHGGIRAPFRHPVPVRLVGQRLPELGQVVLAVGLLDVREELGALTCQMSAAPEQVAGGPHLGGIDVGLREHPATQQNGDVLGVDRVVFGLAAVDRFHIQRRPEDTGHLCLGAEVGAPVPGQETFDRDDQSLTRGCNGLEKWFGSRLHIPVKHALPILIQDAEGPWCERASRCHHKICAAWCRIA
jgi:hypothetical protein